ncbi:hypothetical protein Slin15195_G071630 [Septoria linicola]|uniref:Uncharacterized protein n=1 Tax=Septoria linicola TaxID=215465 RepID=A0A9Q9ASI0_9PEZI|nr:hypothetical protein Slin14017_G104380 [Septoria linicola]USW53844.1 hypothetical protein Slin15195_G071630 [Septoria linicola]
MSGQQDPLEIAKQAERDLNTQEAKGNTKNASDSVNDSGINEAATTKFPGATVKVGGQREVPLEEGGSIKKETGQVTKQEDFEGPGGPEDKAAIDAANRGGDNDIRENVRQGGETKRP